MKIAISKKRRRLLANEENKLYIPPISVQLVRLDRKLKLILPSEIELFTVA